MVLQARFDVNCPFVESSSCSSVLPVRIVCLEWNQTTIIIGNVGNTESDTLCLSRPYAQLTHFGGSDFGVSF